MENKLKYNIKMYIYTQYRHTQLHNLMENKLKYNIKIYIYTQYIHNFIIY